MIILFFNNKIFNLFITKTYLENFLMLFTNLFEKILKSFLKNKILPKKINKFYFKMNYLSFVDKKSVKEMEFPISPTMTKIVM